MHTILKQRWFYGAGVCSIMAGVWFLPLTPIVGSWAASFSAKAAFLPLIGAFGGMGGAMLVTGLRLLFRSMWGAMLDLHIAAHYIPGFCASCAWATRSWLIHVGLPVCCIMLFAVHPVGFAVWYYGLYWLIPVALYFVRGTHHEKSVHTVRAVGTQALASTFIAHAVGSVIWLYTVPMSAAVWRALIPVVAYERCLFAVAATGGYYVLSWGISLVRTQVPLLCKRFVGDVY